MNIHPAIDTDEIDVWNACRQLMLPGARVEVTNYSWQSIKRDAFNSLYARGLANRQSNGATGKYETFTYTPTEKLLAWARQQDLLRASFDDALKGRDVKNEIRNLRRRARYAQQQDRPKSFAKSPPDDYVADWCQRNHLKP